MGNPTSDSTAPDPDATPEPATPEPTTPDAASEPRPTALELAIARAEDEGMVTEDAKVHAEHPDELPVDPSSP